jgi:hypothetical protein
MSRFDTWRQEWVPTDWGRLLRGAAAPLTALTVMVGALSGVLPAPFASAAPAAPIEVRAERFVLTDAAGRTRAELCTRPDGTAGFVLYDTAGRRRGQVAVNGASDSYLSLFDEAGKTRAEVGLNNGGDAAMWTYGADGHTVTWCSKKAETGTWQPGPDAPLLAVDAGRGIGQNRR